MFEQIKNFLRKRKIRKLSRAVPTGLIPLSEISTINFVIDVEENEYDILKDEILAWGKAEDKKVVIYYFDFRKLSANELLLTSIQTTVARKELNWFGMPSYEKVSPLIEQESDLFVSLVDNGDFPIDFVAIYAGDNRQKWESYVADRLSFDVASKFGLSPSLRRPWTE